MTPFAVRVYKVVLGIPIGQVRSYKWVARKAGSPGACRAVGQALKRNPYPLIIPCHRVVKSGGGAGGYALGGDKKRLLLDLEKKIAKCLGD
ncbi:MAG: MGMT family protein [Candidatus Omnitrophica bacterium]|nr:MGMT family protein [Candidatus Omnitrophota bacterium]MDD5042209.1 MGMT family protein [Candidatus Omnitrophota bacterium]